MNFEKIYSAHLANLIAKGWDANETDTLEHATYLTEYDIETHQERLEYDPEYKAEYEKEQWLNGEELGA